MPHLVLSIGAKIISLQYMRSGSVAQTLIILAVIGALSVMSPPASAGDRTKGKKKARLCQVCHGIDGVGRNPTVPNIAGESELYLVKQLKAFRSGERKHEQMTIVASSLSDADIENLSAWYSAIQFSVKLPE